MAADNAHAWFNRGYLLESLERYEDALAELDDLVLAMESGRLPLDELLVAYRRGAALLAFCRDRLQAVEEQVKVLEDGQLKPWRGS